MPIGNDPSLILKALQARLLLEESLGVGYVRKTEDFFTLLQKIRSPKPAATVKKNVHAASAAPAAVPKTAPGPVPPLPKPPALAAETRRNSSSSFTLVPYREPASFPERDSVLEPLRDEALGCQGCGLCERRIHVVWGEGYLGADIMFIGEGPGRDEDEQGRPFVGRSGRLLTDIIEKGMKMPRNSVYIANVVKCRPPGNRDPKPEEIAACSRYLDRQIEVISPKAIVAVGGVAGCALLGLPPRSSGLRGRWHEYNGIPLRVIFHPSYLLRQRRHPDDRTKADRDTWLDVQEVLRLVGERK